MPMLRRVWLDQQLETAAVTFLVRLRSGFQVQAASVMDRPFFLWARMRSEAGNEASKKSGCYRAGANSPNRHCIRSPC
jgi:hypothetical protein